MRVLVLIGLVAFGSPALADTSHHVEAEQAFRNVVAAPEEPLPTATAGELFGQLVFGAVFAVVGGVAGVGAGTKICLDDVGDNGCLFSQIIGGYAGASLGMGVGIWFVGNYSRKDVRASLPVTLLGTTLGAGFGLLTAIAAGGPGAVAALFTPIAGGLIGYRATRHWRSKRSLLPVVSTSNAQGVRVTTLSFGAQW
jgi:hypothetical protein